MQNSLFIEILTEYMPKDAIERYIVHLKTRFNMLFDSYKIRYKYFKILFTKCRIVIYCEDLRFEDAEKERIVLGPPLKYSYNKDNSPTDNLLGFLRKWGKDMDDIIKPYIKDNKEYVAIKVDSELFLKNLFADNLGKILENSKFYKNMKWDETNVTFPRPVRNVVVMFRDTLLALSIFKLETTNTTLNNIIEAKPIIIKTHSLKKYLSIMKKNNEIIDQEERKKIILDELNIIKKNNNTFKEEDLYLLEQWVYECVSPSLGVLEFPEEYLKIPAVFVEHILKNKLYTLPLYDSNGKLVNKVVYVVNKLENMENAGFWLREVICARLDDLKFYWENDLKENIPSLQEKFKYIVFPRSIGNLENKIQKINNLCDIIDNFLPKEYKIDKDYIKNILKFFKLDYVTQTFTEYPELEGHIVYNMLLFKRDFLIDEKVLIDIFQSYKPQNLNDNIPQQLESLVISLLDKVDDVYSFILNGYKPGSQEDPFFVRKKCILISYILHSSILSILPIRSFLDRLYDFYLSYYGGKIEATFKEIWEFFIERYKNFLVEKGYKESIVNMVLQSRWDSFRDVKCKIEAIDMMRGLPFWQALYEIVNRTRRIISGASFDLPFKDELLEQKEEKELYSTYKEFVIQWKDKKFERTGDYVSFAQNFTDVFSEILNEFFDNVFVEVDNIQLQLNRKNLLYQIYRLFVDTVADISQPS
ncbi:MAG: glycine--tRNA ligase subunit beta [Planctomycetota bacterium]